MPPSKPFPECRLKEDGLIKVIPRKITTHHREFLLSPVRLSITVVDNLQFIWNSFHMQDWNHEFCQWHYILAMAQLRGLLEGCEAGVVARGGRKRSNIPGFVGFFSTKAWQFSKLGKSQAHCICAACVENNSLLMKPTFHQITVSQQSMTTKATAASLSFLHPSVHPQNLSNKCANSSFLFLLFCHCLLWQQPLSWGQQGKRTY